MQEELLAPASEAFPEVVIESIRKLYPFPRKKPAEQARIREALGRIMAGEIDGKPRTSEDAIAFLRERTLAARRMLMGREKKFIPHASTFYHQSRYLRTFVQAEDVPENLDGALSILHCYPGIVRGSDFEAHLEALRLISEHIKFLTPTHGNAAESYIRTRVIRFAECVAKWPESDLQFVPGIIKFFKERRYDQDPRHWERKPTAGFASDRDQLHRIA